MHDLLGTSDVKVLKIKIITTLTILTQKNTKPTGEAVVWGCSIRKSVFKTFVDFLKNSCAGVSFLTKLQAVGLQLY